MRQARFARWPSELAESQSEGRNVLHPTFARDARARLPAETSNIGRYVIECAVIVAKVVVSLVNAAPANGGGKKRTAGFGLIGTSRSFV